jgi:SAM-dependent MidA family methyltransferase
LSEEPHGEVGVFYSNELIDSFPVHRVQFQNGSWHEMAVSFREAQWKWDRLEVSPTLAEEIARRNLPTVEGYTTELNLAAGPWLQETAARLQRGFFLTMDYGRPRADYYDAGRTDGTLRGYFQHRRQDDPLQNIGEQDLTCDVDWDTLMESGTEVGLMTLGWVDQQHAVVGIWEKKLAAGTFAPEDVRAFQTLSHPAHLGQRFQWLVQAKGLTHAEAHSISALRFFSRVP